MATIRLNVVKSYNEGHTTKYWRTIQCQPQTVELKKWSTDPDHPYFILKGEVIQSHDEREIGTQRECHIQTYSFWLEPLVKEGVYHIS
jgi:hypothetical protein